MFPKPVAYRGTRDGQAVRVELQQVEGERWFDLHPQEGESFGWGQMAGSGELYHLAEAMLRPWGREGVPAMARKLADLEGSWELSRDQVEEVLRERVQPPPPAGFRIFNSRWPQGDGPYLERDDDAE